MKKLLFLMVVLAMLVSLVIPVATAASTPVSTATISTDKPMYHGGETVTITGSGFLADTAIVLTINGPDGEPGPYRVVDTVPGVTSDAGGAFVATYVAPGIPGNYKVSATDGTNTAETHFADPTMGLTCEGYNIPTEGGFKVEWVTGNLGKSYDEGEWVPYQFTFTGIQAANPVLGLLGIGNLTIGWDFTGGNKADSPRFGDLVRDIQVGTTKLTNDQGFPKSDGTAYDIPTLADANLPQNDPNEYQWNGFTLLNLPNSQVNIPLSGSPTVTDDVHVFVVTPAQLIAAGILNTADAFTIYFQIHESRTFVWNNSLQSQYDQAPTDAWGGWLYGESPYITDKREGSGYVPGSSGHVHNEGAGGAKDVPLPIPPKPLGLIDGNKFQGNLTGTGIPNWYIFIYGLVEGNVVFSTHAITDANGFYQFGNLTAGTWYIGELQGPGDPVTTPWNQTYPNGSTGNVSPGAVPTLVSNWPLAILAAVELDIGADVLADWGWAVTLTPDQLVQHDVDFANVLYGCLEVTKTVDLSAAVNPTAISQDFTVNITGPGGYGNSTVFHLVNGVLQAPTTVKFSGLIPGTYSAIEVNPGSEWTVAYTPASGNASVVTGASCAQIGVKNTYIPGCLELTKTVDLSGYMYPGNVTKDFTVNITGPGGYGNSTVFHLVNGVLQAPTTVKFSGLAEGTYSAVEVNPGSEWTVAYTPASGNASVVTGTSCAQIGVKNTIKLPHTTMTVFSYVWDTTTGNVEITITDCNDGNVSLTNAHVHLAANGVEYALFSPMGNESTYFTGGDSNGNGLMDPLECWTWKVTVTISVTTKFETWGGGTDPFGNPVDYDPVTKEGYATEYNDFTIEVGGLTRTQGFWATHLDFTTYVFNKYTGNPPDGNESTPGYIDLGWLPPITNINDLMGVFWANNAKNSNGSARDPNKKLEPLCQARETASNQALAAILNSSIPGGAALPAGYNLSQIASILHGNNITAIQKLNSDLDTFNNSGEGFAFDSSLPPTGRANPNDPKTYTGAKNIANIPFADCSNSIGLAALPRK